MRLEQRNGRVDRHGQARDVTAFHFASDEDEDTKFLDYVVRKVDQVRDDLGSVGDVIDRALEERFSAEDVAESELDRRIDQTLEHAAERLDLPRRRRAPRRGSAPAPPRRWNAPPASCRIDPDRLRRLLAGGVRRRPRQARARRRTGRTGCRRCRRGWERVVDASLRLDRRGAVGALPRLVFDTEALIETVGPRTALPRAAGCPPDAARPPGHAPRGLRRSTGGSGSRATTCSGSRSARSPGLDEPVLVVPSVLTIVNELREPLHAELVELAFRVTDSDVAAADAIDAEPAAARRRRASSGGAAGSRIAGPTSRPAIEEHRESRRGRARGERPRRSSPACSSRSRRPRQTLYDRRIRELDATPARRGRERLRREIEKLEAQMSQLTFDAGAPGRPGGAPAADAAAARGGRVPARRGAARAPARAARPRARPARSTRRCRAGTRSRAARCSPSAPPCSSPKPASREQPRARLVGRSPPRRDADRAGAARGALSRAPRARPACRTTGSARPGSPPRAPAPADAPEARRAFVSSLLEETLGLRGWQKASSVADEFKATSIAGEPLRPSWALPAADGGAPVVLRFDEADRLGVGRSRRTHARLVELMRRTGRAARDPHERPPAPARPRRPGLRRVGRVGRVDVVRRERGARVAPRAARAARRSERRRRARPPATRRRDHERRATARATSRRCSASRCAGPSSCSSARSTRELERDTELRDALWTDPATGSDARRRRGPRGALPGRDADRHAARPHPLRRVARPAACVGRGLPRVVRRRRSLPPPRRGRPRRRRRRRGLGVVTAPRRSSGSIHDGSPHPDLPVRAYGGQLFRPGDLDGRRPGAQGACRASSASGRPTRRSTGSCGCSRSGGSRCAPAARRAGWPGRSTSPTCAPSTSASSTRACSTTSCAARRPTTRSCSSTSAASRPCRSRGSTRSRRPSARSSSRRSRRTRRRTSRPKATRTREPGGRRRARTTATRLDGRRLGRRRRDEPRRERRSADDDAIVVVHRWAREAVVDAGRVRRPRGTSGRRRRARAPHRRRGEEAVAAVVPPGRLYLVASGGLRKGSGSFYTRPALAVPLVQRTLEPLCYARDGESLVPRHARGDPRAEDLRAGDGIGLVPRRRAALPRRRARRLVRAPRAHPAPLGARDDRHPSVRRRRDGRGERGGLRPARPRTSASSTGFGRGSPGTSSSAASTASTSTRWPSSSPGSRSGSRRSTATCRSSTSTTS